MRDSEGCPATLSDRATGRRGSVGRAVPSRGTKAEADSLRVVGVEGEQERGGSEQWKAAIFSDFDL